MRSLVNLWREYIFRIYKISGNCQKPARHTFTLRIRNLDCALTQSIPDKLKHLQKQLLNELDSCLECIQITDYGAGSKHLKNKRSIRSIAKTSASRGTYGWFLYRIAKHFEPKNILELGTSLGIGSWHLMHGFPSCSLITVEGCPETARIAAKTLHNLPSAQLINAQFSDFLPTLNRAYQADLIFIDGHHNGDAMLNYIEQLLPHSHDETIFILDDIRWSDSMFAAWQQLEDDNRFHVSIDFFRMGFIVKRPQQRKERFTLSV